MESGKKAFKLNIIDIIITLIVAGIIAVGVFMLASAFGVSADNKNEVEVVYTLQFKGVEDIYKGNVKIGDTIIDGRTRFNIGTVQAVDDSEPFYVDIFNEFEEKMVKAEHPDHHTLYVTIKTKAICKDGAYYIKSEDFPIAVGLPIAMHAPDLCKEGYICNVEILK